MTCASATRFLPAAPFIAPMRIVLVVPRSAPTAIAAADGSSMTLACSAASVTIITAELDCTMPANAMPNTRYCQRARSVSRSTFSASASAPTLFFMNTSPISKKPSATASLPASALRPLSVTSISDPMPTSGSDALSRSSLKPSVATIQPVNVVPRLAPKMTPSALPSDMMPAPTNASTISPTSELDCTKAVVAVPAKIAFSGVSV